MKTARAWRAAGRGLALATVTETWRSAPCPAGSRMIVDDRGHFAGSVSGGCIETSVISEAIESIRGGETVTLRYGVSDEMGQAAGLTCGGSIEVHVEPLDERLIDALERPTPLVRAIDLDSGAWTMIGQGDPGEEGWPEAVREVARELSGRDAPEIVARDERRFFIQPDQPPARLIVVGAVRVAQSLAVLAREVGLRTVVVDPRPTYLIEERFPGVARVADWPDAALAKLSPDSRCAVVTLTHDARPDDAGLIAAVRSPAFYVGALGSRRTHAKRVARLRAAGLSEAEMARIDAPAGLDIGSRRPPEIALSILAAVIAALNRERGGE